MKTTVCLAPRAEDGEYRSVVLDDRREVDERLCVSIPVTFLIVVIKFLTKTAKEGKRLTVRTAWRYGQETAPAFAKHRQVNVLLCLLSFYSGTFAISQNGIYVMWTSTITLLHYIYAVFKVYPYCSMYQYSFLIILNNILFVFFKKKRFEEKIKMNATV